MSQDIRMLVGDGTNVDVILWDLFPVIDTTYAVTVTHDGSRNYKLFIDGVEISPKSTTTAVTGSTLSSNPVKLGANVFTSDTYYRGLQDEIMFCDKALSLAEHTEWYNGGDRIEDYTELSFSANIEGFFLANDYNGTEFPNQAGANVISTPNSRDYFHLPYDIHTWNPNVTINATNYVNNPIVNGTSVSSEEAYAGDVCTAPDGDIVGGS